MMDEIESATAVRRLLALTEGQLEAELGQELLAARYESEGGQGEARERAIGFGAGRDAIASNPGLTREVGRRFLAKFHEGMLSLICNDLDRDNVAIRLAVTEGIEALTLAISTTLMHSFGWIPAIAGVIAVILAKRIAAVGYEAFCETWKKHAPPGR
jgi:hypothetical protein